MNTHLATLLSAELDGLDAHLIEVETDMNVGLHSFTIVGLADKALSEAKERVNSALKNAGVKPPTRENRRITVNLAPADIKKTGSQYDIAIALGYLRASGQLAEFNGKDKLFIGELSLDGRLRPVGGVLSVARLAERKGIRELYVPSENGREAAMIAGIIVYPVPTLRAAIDHLEGKKPITPLPQTKIETATEVPFVDIGDIKGQETAKRVLLIAAAGGHNLLMVGPPGSGKTMLAEALTSILPLPSNEEIIELTEIYSAAGALEGKSFIAHRPFRSPHQTASPAAIMGGGQIPKPGEVSLAHRGVLFLDEFPEFRRDLLESLREPIESGRARITRVRGSLTLPARFMLVAAMNPCPCGYYGDEEKECKCGAHEVLRYQKKLSGPLLDRIDLQITVPRVKPEALRRAKGDPDIALKMRTAVAGARDVQRERLEGIRGKFTNAELSSAQCDKLIALAPGTERFLESALKSSFLSARGYYRILKTARTIADLEPSDVVREEHLAEAFSYRLKQEN